MLHYNTVLRTNGAIIWKKFNQMLLVDDDSYLYESNW